LNKIAASPASTVQAKLLRFLEEESFKRIGGSADIRVDVRVIAATKRT
jgi:transcriptional regulator with PAS, ATPase and Fis domain